MNNLITIFKKPKFYNFVLYMLASLSAIFLIVYCGIYKKEVEHIVLGLCIISTSNYLMLKNLPKDICRNLSFKNRKILKILFLIAIFSSSVFSMIWFGIRKDINCLAVGLGLLFQSISLFDDLRRNKNKQCKEESASAKLKK